MLITLYVILIQLNFYLINFYPINQLITLSRSS